MKYAVARSVDAEHWQGIFDSVEDAVKNGPSELGYEGEETQISVAEANLFQPFISVETILEQLEDDCGSECGEAADLFAPSGASESAKQELEESLNAVLTTWLTKHKELATCYSVSNPVRYELKPKSK